MSQQELLSVFELEPNASWEDVRTAYHRLTEEWHPDRFRSNERLKRRADCFARQLNTAFNELERIYINGAWAFATTSAYGYLSDTEKESPSENPQSNQTEKTPPKEPWGFEVFGLPIDLGVLGTAVGIAAILSLPILYALGAEIQFPTGLHHPFSNWAVNIADWGTEFTLSVTSKLVGFLY